MSVSLKRARSPSPSSTPEIFKSSPIEDRSSTFIAVFSPVCSVETLHALPDYKKASHRITAWRLPGKQQSLDSKSVIETGYDDDGEKYGGKTLEKVLISQNVAGAIMVARWYGGVMLGPVRFDHIRNCAANAIAQWTQETERAAKRTKTATEKSRLMEILPERDQSIAILRDLLAEKRKGVTSSQTSVTSSPSKGPDYTVMDLAVLERLEEVRDRTIGWILAQIEEAEKATEEVVSAVQDSQVGQRPPGTVDEKSSKAALVHEALTDSKKLAEEASPP